MLAGAPDTWQQRAMVAYLAVAGIGGVLSYVTAGVMFSVLAPSTLPHVTVPPGSSARCRLAKVHRQVVPAQDYQHRDGVIVTTPSRLLVDMARVLGRAPLEELVDDVFCRGLTSIDSVATSLERAGLGHHGHALLRDVIDVWSPTIEPGSIAEIRLLRLLGELGATGLVTQHEVLDANGAFIGRLDVARPDRKCGLEYDSVRFHGPRQWERDERRYGQLRAAGWWDDAGPVATAILASRTPLAMCGNCMAIGVSRESNWSSSTRTRPGSTSPMADRTDDVSMTRIIIRAPDQAAVAAQVLDRNVESPVDVEPLSPLDHHRPVLRQLLEAQVAQLRQVLHPVEVDMRELHATWIDAD